MVPEKSIGSENHIVVEISARNVKLGEGVELQDPKVKFDLGSQASPEMVEIYNRIVLQMVPIIRKAFTS